MMLLISKAVKYYIIIILINYWIYFNIRSCFKTFPRSTVIIFILTHFDV